MILHKSPKLLYNYEDLILDTVDPGWVIIPSHNMVENVRRFKFPNLLLRNSEYAYTAFDDYYRSDLYRRDDPFHFMIEKVGEEWDIHLGTPQINRSWFIKDLIKDGVIHSYFQNIRVIMINDDFRHNLPEERCYKKLWHVLLSEWVRRKSQDFRFIRFFDDIVNWDVYNSLTDCKYTLEQSQYWNRKIFERQYQYYKKF